MRHVVFASLLAGSTLAGIAPALAQEGPVIVLPGAPGQPSRTIDAAKAMDIANPEYSPTDVMYLQMMIPHHQQAVVMSELAKTRASTPTVRAAADRILLSQEDEMKFMRGWLSDRGEAVAMPAGHMQHADMEKMGMASAAEMAELETLSGAAFDAMFLRLMIDHHEGAVDMTEDLLQQPGTAYDPVFYAFTQDLVTDQNAEIRRMTETLAGLSADPRATLKAGFRDAGEAIHGLIKVASLGKPEGFYDPANPSGAQPRLKGDEAKGDGGEPQFVQRGSPMNQWNSDMAFAGDHLFVGNFHGFNIYTLAADGTPSLTTSVVCPGGQGDMSVVGDLLIMSVEQTSGRVDCGIGGVSERVSKDRFRGVRIFDISDITRPRQVGQVQTCRGSHTHSVVSDGSDDGTMIVYNSGTAGVRDEKELAGCIGDVAGDNRTALYSIDVIEIPVADPAKARIVARPRIFANAEGQVAGLWRGGDHGEGTQSTATTNQCHDITVFPSKKIAAGACSGNGLLLNISDPRAPKRLQAVTDPGFAYWHSATFNNDGTKVIYTDEWGGGTRPRCRPQDPETWGADAIYRIDDDKLVREGSYKLSVPQDEFQNCVAHNGSIVPVPGRDIFVQAWYQGGLSMLDFTDPGKAHEIAYFDRGPISADQLTAGGFWSTYWYDGNIYATAMVRGLDVFALAPSDEMTANEIAAAEMAQVGPVVNPQDQYPVTWPDHPVIAKAYADQLLRSGAIDASYHDDLIAMLDRAVAPVESGTKDASVAKMLVDAAAQMPALTGIDGERGAALGELIARLARTLR